MAGLSGMNSCALIAAALATSPDHAQPGTRIDENRGDMLIPPAINHRRAGGRHNQAKYRSGRKRIGDGNTLKRATAHRILPSLSPQIRKTATQRIGPGHTADSHSQGEIFDGSQHGDVGSGRSLVRDQDHFLGLAESRQKQRSLKDDKSHTTAQQGPIDLHTDIGCHQEKEPSAHGGARSLEPQNIKTHTSQRSRTQRQSAYNALERTKKHVRLSFPPDESLPSPSRLASKAGDDEDDEDYDPDSQSEKSEDEKMELLLQKSKKADAGSLVTPSKSRSKSNIKAEKRSGSGRKPPSTNRSTSAKNRTYALPVASTLAEASEADKMMFRMKDEGKPWKQITAEWSRMTGKTPATSSLSVRYLKLREKIAKSEHPDLNRLLHFKIQIEQAWEAHEKWDRLAGRIQADGGGEYSGQNLRVWYRNLMKKYRKTSRHISSLPTDASVMGVQVGDAINRDVKMMEVLKQQQQGDTHHDACIRARSVSDLDSLDHELLGDQDGENGINNNNGDDGDSPDRSRTGSHCITQQTTDPTLKDMSHYIPLDGHAANNGSITATQTPAKISTHKTLDIGVDTAAMDAVDEELVSGWL